MKLWEMHPSSRRTQAGGELFTHLLILRQVSLFDSIILIECMNTYQHPGIISGCCSVEELMGVEIAVSYLRHMYG